MKTFVTVLGAAALGAVMAVGVASSHDMAGMEMNGSDMGAMDHMAPNAMGGHMQMMENHMRMTDLRPANAGG
jgi:hypothetical protein